MTSAFGIADSEREALVKSADGLEIHVIRREEGKLSGGRFAGQVKTCCSRKGENADKARSERGIDRPRRK